MANVNSPFGFRPVIRLGGAPFSIQEYGKAATNSYTIFMGDMVMKVTGADPLPESIQAQGYNLPTIQTGYQGTVGTTLWQGVSLNYGALSTATVHAVADEIDCIFICQCDAGNSMTTASYVGKNANINITGNTGSLVTKLSGMQVNTTTIATTNTFDLKVTRIAQISPNAEGTNAIVEVLINKHQFGQAALGV